MSRAGPSLLTTKDGRYWVARFNGKTVHFGRAGDPAARRAFDEYKARWLLNGRQLPDDGPTRRAAATEPLTVQQLADRYLVGRESDTRIPSTLAVLTELFGSLRATDFSPRALKTVREQFVANGHCRTEVNRRVTEIRMAFSWAVSEELVGPEVLTKLTTVKGLRKGQTTAPEATKKRIPTDAELDAVIARLPAPFDAILTVLRHTGARVTEILRLRPADIVKSDGLWTIVYDDHKTAHHDGAGQREIELGPRAQLALARYVNGRADDELLFPTVADHRTVHQYLRRATKAAGVEPFPPSAMRHMVNTSIDDPVEAMAVLGHKNLDQQKTYRRTSREKRREWARKHG